MTAAPSPDRVAFYARYSSDLQSDKSIEDQLRLCREYAARRGWTAVEVYIDAAVSGASLHRPGIQALLADADLRKFDKVLVEAVDRLSRDTADMANMRKALAFNGIEIHTPAGVVTMEMAAIHGMMGEHYLIDLGKKVRRGLRGVVEAGHTGGGRPYGYRIEARTNQKGERIAGTFIIDPDEAEVVRRIMREIARGDSSLAITKRLNAEGIAGPRGPWRRNSILGSFSRQTGMIHNTIYRGVITWNRQRFLKHPVTGKRVSKLNPPSEWITIDAPHLRVIDDALWAEVQLAVRKNTLVSLRGRSPERARRATRPLNGLLKCGVCGSNYIVKDKLRMCCALRAEGGPCTNDHYVKISEVEGRVTAGLKSMFDTHGAAQAFAAAYADEMKRLQAGFLQSRKRLSKTFSDAAGEMERLLDAVAKGRINGAAVSAAMERIDQAAARKADAQAELAALDRAQPAAHLHPKAHDVYRREIDNLESAMKADPEIGRVTAAHLKHLVESIVVHPLPKDAPTKPGKADLEITGYIRGVLDLAQGLTPQGFPGFASPRRTTRSGANVGSAGALHTLPPTEIPGVNVGSGSAALALAPTVDGRFRLRLAA